MGTVDQFRNFQCRAADRVGLDLCVCCCRWHWKSRMGHIDGLCRHCSAFVEMDRIMRDAGLYGFGEPA